MCILTPPLTPMAMEHALTSISRYETGASVPTIDTLMKLANVLKKPSAYFLEGLG